MASHIRDCFIPRPRWAYVSTDYAGIEMVTLAQVNLWLFGYSEMAKSINKGEDQHCRLVASMINKPFDEVVALKKAGDPYILSLRQAAKPGNYGFAGGMGVPKFVATQRKAKDDDNPRGIRFCEILKRQARCGDTPFVVRWNGRSCPPVCPICCEIATEILKAYKTAWPEMNDFFKYCSEECSGPAGGYLIIPGSKVIRGPLRFSQFANGHFQGLAAIGAKEAMWNVSRECYTVKSSPLYGTCRPVAFIHDEILSEIILAYLHEAAYRQAEIMVSTMRKYTPDVNVEAKPAACLRWLKKMEPVHVNGRLIPWEPGMIVDKNGELIGRKPCMRQP